MAALLLVGNEFVDAEFQDEADNEQKQGVLMKTIRSILDEYVDLA